MGAIGSSVPAVALGGIALAIAVFLLISAAFKIVIGTLGLPFGA